MEIGVEADQIIIRPLEHPRAGWMQAFTTLASQSDDCPWDDDCPLLSQWDDDEWEW